jgi:hypothetical protein
MPTRTLRPATRYRILSRRGMREPPPDPFPFSRESLANPDPCHDVWISALDSETLMLFVGDRWQATIPAAPFDHPTLNQLLFTFRSRCTAQG